MNSIFRAENRFIIYNTRFLLLQEEEKCVKINSNLIRTSRVVDVLYNLFSFQSSNIGNILSKDDIPKTITLANCLKKIKHENRDYF